MHAHIHTYTSRHVHPHLSDRGEEAYREKRRRRRRDENLQILKKGHSDIPVIYPAAGVCTDTALDRNPLTSPPHYPEPSSRENHRRVFLLFTVWRLEIEDLRSSHSSLETSHIFCNDWIDREQQKRKQTPSIYLFTDLYLCIPVSIYPMLYAIQQLLPLFRHPMNLGLAGQLRQKAKKLLSASHTGR